MPLPLEKGCTVAIIGPGSSILSYVQQTASKGKPCYCTLAVGAIASVIVHDAAFVMEPLDALLDSSEAFEWLRSLKTDGPVFSSASSSAVPSSMDYPLEDVMNDLELDYFSCSAAYAIAYAISQLAASEIHIFGLDAQGPERACIEVLLLMAVVRGIRVFLAPGCSLWNNTKPFMYGYNMLAQPLRTAPSERNEIVFRRPLIVKTAV